MQGWSPVREDPTCWEQLSPCTTTTEPVLQVPEATTLSPHAATTEAPEPCSLCPPTREATAVRSSHTIIYGPCSPLTREKPTHEDPAQSKIQNYFLKNAYLIKNLYSNGPRTLKQTNPLIIGKDWNIPGHRGDTDNKQSNKNIPKILVECMHRHLWKTVWQLFSVITWAKHWIQYVTSGGSQVSYRLNGKLQINKGKVTVFMSQRIRLETSS